MTITEAPYNNVLQLRQQVMYPDKDIDFVKLADDDKGLHIGVFVANELVSVMSIFMNGRDVQFRKLATRNDMQNKGYASALMKWLIDYAKDVKLDRLWCNSRANAVDFYKRFGFEETDERFTKDGYDFVVVEKSFLK
ncbi:GNAT family N-acetyltransferase [Dysgonomonas sp. ZJ279]|uniref:GNAT family N-acetyltransferase n=1 Tax=Dysgonomonas sp. ZJ279 TaxID=2709796 RepID=UPI0013EB055B|nr:GNAT family N-acetyltransferase [Dysgonomonas sp. ZJ279]